MIIPWPSRAVSDVEINMDERMRLLIRLKSYILKGISVLLMIVIISRTLTSSSISSSMTTKTCN